MVKSLTTSRQIQMCDNTKQEWNLSGPTLRSLPTRDILIASWRQFSELEYYTRRQRQNPCKQRKWINRCSFADVCAIFFAPVWRLPLNAVYVSVHDKIRSESFTVAANISRRSAESRGTARHGDYGVFHIFSFGIHCSRMLRLWVFCSPTFRDSTVPSPSTSRTVQEECSNRKHPSRYSCWPLQLLKLWPQRSSKLRK